MFNKLKGNERAELETKSIQYLRELADAIGVDSPTLMGKEDLIDEILVVLMGGPSEKKKETRGRPKKDFKPSIFEPQQDLKRKEVVVEYDTIAPKGLGVGIFASGEDNSDEFTKRRANVYDSYISYYQKKLKRDDESKTPDIQELIEANLEGVREKYTTATIEQLLEEDDAFSIKYGYVYIKDEKYYILEDGFNLDKRIEINDVSMLQKETLRNGDEVHYYLVNRDKTPVILSVNFIDVDEVGGRIDFKNLTAECPSTKFNSINLVNVATPIACGSRNLIVGDYDTAKFVGARILKKIAKVDKKVYIYTLGVDLMKEEAFALKSVSDVFLQVASKKDKCEEQEKILLFIERIKRLAELGNDVILYLAGYSKIKYFFENSTALTMPADHLFGIGAKFKDYGSITTIIVDKKSPEIEDLEEFVTNKICVEDVEDELINPYIKLSQCKTLFVDKFLTIGEIEEMEKIKTNWNNFDNWTKKNLINKYD